MRTKRIHTILLSLAIALYCSSDLMADARYVFYFIGDGMGMGHVNATETYNRDILKSADPLLMLRFPVASQVRTYSANSRITDSAAAGTALSTGSKTLNHMVGEGADSLPRTSIAADFQRAGYGVGVATSVAGDDATPAAFYAHAHNRGQKYDIAPQSADAGYDFYAGAAWRGSLDKEGKENEWFRKMENAGYKVLRGNREWNATGGVGSANRAVLVSEYPQGDQIGYTIDSIATSLTLPQITDAALAVMRNTGKDRFFLMIEGGNIDWAAHANDGAAVIKEILNFQEAIQIAYDFYLEHPQETLIVITADHDTGGMAIGRQDNQKNPRFEYIDLQRTSIGRFSERCRELIASGKSIGFDEMKCILSNDFGLYGAYQPTEEEDKALREAFANTFTLHSGKDEKTLYEHLDEFSVKVLDAVNRAYGIGWTTHYHTGNFVPLYAIGEGSGLFTGNLNNTEIPELILKAAGIERK